MRDLQQYTVSGSRWSKKERGAIKGPIRIPLHSQLFPFNALAFPCIPSKSLKFRLVVFSIPTAPTNHPSDWSGLCKNARRQTGANSPHEFSATRVTPGLEESRH